MPIDGQKIKDFFTRKGSPSKTESAVKGPVAAVIGASIVGGLGKLAKGKKSGTGGKKPIRTAISKVKNKIQENRDFKKQQKSIKEQNAPNATFKPKRGSKVAAEMKRRGK